MSTLVPIIIFICMLFLEDLPELHEKSAGGIVYRKRNNVIEILLLAWKNAKEETEYVLPKGKIENDETAAETARREIAEETGLPIDFLEVIKFMNTINYSFVAAHKEGTPMIHKEVSLFLVKYSGREEPRPRREERFIGYKWFEPEKLQDIFMKPDVYGFIEKNKHFM